MTILHAGEVGRFDSFPNLQDNDTFLLFIDDTGALVRITASEAKNYFSSNLNIKDIVFADSPYLALTSNEVINVDATAGNVIINLFPLVKGELIRIKKIDVSANTITYQGNGFNIDGAASRVITGQYNADTLIGGSTEWGRY